MNSIKMIVKNWSAWMPDMIDDRAQIDLSFVNPMMRRRLSKLSRVTMHTAHNCLQKTQHHENIILIFCSQYGEIQQTSEILKTLAEKEDVSPLAFSQSVHNTSVGLFSIAEKLQSPSIVISAGNSSLEFAFIEAWAQMQTDHQSNVLLVYHDEPLPKIFSASRKNLEAPLETPLAFAFLLAPHEKKCEMPTLHLDWKRKKHENDQDNKIAAEAPLYILHLLKTGKGSCTRLVNRLEWAWKITGKSKLGTREHNIK